MHGPAIRERLFQAIDQSGDTLKQVSDKIGVNYSYLSALRKKKGFDISAELIAKFCKAYSISPTWILLGENPQQDTLEAIHKRLDDLFHRDNVLEILLQGIIKPGFIKSDKRGSKN